VLKGDEFLSIPLEKCWTVAAARSCPEIAALGEDVLECVSEYSLIAIHMLVMKNQGADAEDFRREHLEMLSSAKFETLLDWTEEDLQMLAGSKWAMVAPACKQDIRAEFEELQEVLAYFFATHAIDCEGFLWAHRVLISRAVQFFMEDGSMLYVLGGADMLNHSVDVPVGNDDVQLRRSEKGEQLLVVRACRDYKAGEQAFFSYSDASNGRLLMMAGFVVAENPYDAVELMLTFPVTQDSLPCYLNLAEGLDAGVRTPGAAVAEETKVEFLETLPPEADQPSEVALHVRLSQNALLAQLERVLAFFRLQQLCRGGKAPTADLLAASDSDPSSRAQALKSLQGALVSMQQGYPTSLETDQSELPIAEASGNMRKVMALRVVIGEKLVFRSALGFLEQMLQDK
jgi:hypothetical protein